MRALTRFVARRVTLHAPAPVGLIPPVPVMVLAGGTFAAGFLNAFVDGKSYSKYVFVVQMIINLVVFVMDPGQVVKETWSVKAQHARVRAWHCHCGPPA